MNFVACGFIDEREKLAFPATALARAGIGAAIGGAGGALANKQHRVKGALLGAGIGGAAGYGAHKFLGRADTAAEKSMFEKYKHEPFHAESQVPWSQLRRHQKARVIGGIAANTAMGVVPTVAAGGYAVNRLRGKDSYKTKYENLLMQQHAHEKALQNA